MTFFLVNVGGNFEPIAMRLKVEGNKIYYYKEKPNVNFPGHGSDQIGVGIFEKDEMVDDIFEVINKFRSNKKDLIILFDDNGFGNTADFLRSDGFQVIGGADWCDKVEYERSLGTKLMQDIGLQIPPQNIFNKIDDAIKYIEIQKDDYRCVMKPEGESFAGTSRTYTAKNKQDMLDYLKWTKQDIEEKHTPIGKFLIQDFIEGYEADFAAYFNGDDFIDACLVTIEEKKSGDGKGGGEATGCMGNIVINFPQNKYFKLYLEKLAPILKKVGYVGEISINNIFSKKDGKVYGLETTPRLGHDAMVTEAAILQEAGIKLSDFYTSLIDKKPFSFPENLVGCGIRVYTGSTSLKKDDVAGRYFSFKEDIKEYLWMYCASYKNKSYVIEDNPVLVVNCVMPKLFDAIKGAYEYMDEVNIPDAYYRSEIGSRAKEVLTFLSKSKWI